ncbi:hypothetical protein D3C81_1726660 [compost metagenome]
MHSLPMTGRAKLPPPSSFLLLFVLASTMFLLHGCGNNQYRAVPQCDVFAPPKAERYVKASPDEKLIQMTNAYIGQTKNVSDCNEKIRLANAANKAVDK